MLEDITYLPIFGKPLIFYLGVATILSFFITAAQGYLSYTGKMNTSVGIHQKLAGFSILLSILHAALGVLAYF